MADSPANTDSKLNEALEETFPASDPPANTVETGIRIGPVPTSANATVTDNRSQHRFELSCEGQTAFLLYERTVGALTLIHTEVPISLRGRHVGETLVNAALHAARSEGLRIIAVCPFVKTYLRKHPPASLT